MGTPSLLARLRRDNAGAMIIETAILAPVLILLSLGAYQVSSAVARESELQNAMNIAQGVALASAPDDDAKRTTLKQIISASTGVPIANIQVTAAYRCNSGVDYVAAESTCTIGDKVSSYVKINISDTYEPVWTEFGVGEDITLSVERYILLQQSTRL